MASNSPKLVSEPTREREAFKYGASLLNDITNSPSEGAPHPSGRDTPSRNENEYDDTAGTEIASRDTVLASLAQLGLWRTGTDRALISLFDRTHQYIVTETTQQSSLAPGSIRPGLDNGELCLYPGTFPRHFSVCDRALMADTNNPSALGNDLPLTLIPDLTADPRFSKIPHPLLRCSARFYAAVPIRSPAGVDIGVYCVVDPLPREANSWSPSNTQALREISSNIMQYLRSKSVGDAYRRSVRMTRGIGSFVEEESTMAGWKAGANSPAFHDDATREGALNSEQQALQKFRDLNIQGNPPVDRKTQPNVAEKATGMSPGDSRQANMSDTSSKSILVEESDANAKEKAMARIFSRAANLIREGIEIEGVLFLDANLEASITDPTLQHNDSYSNPGASSSSDEATHISSDNENEPCCAILGFATSTSSSINLDSGSDLHAAMPMKLLAALLRRYPTGKIFNFDENGGLLSSGTSEEDLSSPIIKQDYPVEGSASRLPSKNQRPWSRASEGPALSKIFPGARSVAFAPVWDPKRDRWLAGNFTYTQTPTRSFTIEGELSYLRAFCMLAMSEAQRLETLLVNKAQSDVLGSLSHELRTPLHGIMLAAELLTDTQLDVFQGNLLRTLETCGRTLSETIDHLLYFSKVNQAAVHRKRERRTRKRSIVSDPAAMIAAGVSTSQVRLDALVEEVMDSVFAGHVFKHNEGDKVWQTSKRHESLDITDDLYHPRHEHMAAGQEENQLKSEVPLGHENQVAVFLDINPYVPYLFNVAAGALRRVIMNLFGNSLKYTQQGTITISLSQKPLFPERPNSNKRLVTITVKDTGQGIAPDFLRNDLFKPFSQENHLSNGTGLGLSLVKKIVASMGGKISIESEVKKGTTVTVMLPLSRSNGSEDFKGQDENEVDEGAKRLKGLRVRLVGFPSDKAIEADSAPGIHMSAMQTMCQRWLQMDIVPEDSYQDVAPDLVLCEEQAIADPVLKSEELIRSPVVVVCANAINAHKRSSDYKKSGDQRVYEFVSQPIGPHKLVRILHIAFRRWGDLQALSPAEPTGTDENESTSTSDSTRNRFNGGNLRADALDTRPTTSGLGPESARRPRLPPRVVSARVSPDAQLQTSSSAGGPKSFLLVDDNPINLSVLCAYMKKLKSKYATAADGLEAVERFRENPDLFSCILMDISMPRMDGIEATKQIRAFENREGREPVLILALTGLASASAQQDAYASGVDVFMSKPIKLKELSTILKEWSLA
ncbi:nik-1 (Os-1p) [Fusarium heterosporum]|uniref:histidine kinase n=1 Tax=Fusarium heterosporum TaxID=42747 RepID=A0A8H5TX09_FUSHE|nr:nik-1 (Os-1p) [Fusarium heterosporum]